MDCDATPEDFTLAQRGPAPEGRHVPRKPHDADAAEVSARIDSDLATLILLCASRRVPPDNRKSIAGSFVQHCVLPRIKCGPADGLYCYHFIMAMHEMEASCFHTLVVLDRVVKMLLPSMSSLTGREAGSLGLMLERVIVSIERWRVGARGRCLIWFQTTVSSVSNCASFKQSDTQH